MALTNQPYLPLYVQDWLTNNKLKQCSLGAHGLMINIMCLMHKEETYGKLLIKQKFKQTPKPVKNFACMVAKLLPFDFAEIEIFLLELIDEKILRIDEDFIICDRMVNDAEISHSRAKNGKKGGKKTQQKVALKFAKAKIKANTEYENEYINNTIITNNNTVYGGIFKNFNLIFSDELKQSCLEILTRSNLGVKGITIDLVENLFIQFSETQKSSDEFYANEDKIWTHFKRWLPKQTIKDIPKNKKNDVEKLPDANELAKKYI